MNPFMVQFLVVNFSMNAESDTSVRLEFLNGPHAYLLVQQWLNSANGYAISSEVHNFGNVGKGRQEEPIRMKI